MKLDVINNYFYTNNEIQFQRNHLFLFLAASQLVLRLIIVLQHFSVIKLKVFLLITFNTQFLTPLNN